MKPEQTSEDRSLKQFTTRELLQEIRDRGAAENYYTYLGDDMAIGAMNLMGRLPVSMLNSTGEET